MLSNILSVSKKPGTGSHDNYWLFPLLSSNGYTVLMFSETGFKAHQSQPLQPLTHITLLLEQMSLTTQVK